MRAKCCALFLGLSLAGCGDQLGWGYMNKLPYPVTVVRHAGRDSIRTTLQPLHCSPGGFGPNLPFDILAPDGTLIAHYRPSQIPVHGDDPLSYVVIRKEGVSVEPKAIALQGVPKEYCR